jgi:predicted nucleotidyltransferase
MKSTEISPQIAVDNRLSEIVRRILFVGDPQKIVLFGSRARGEAHSDSDYDILIIEPSNLPRYKRPAKYRRALVGTALAKDIIVWTPGEVAEWSGVPNAFITVALNEGIVLYERSE